jgi:hypothetical protein
VAPQNLVATAGRIAREVALPVRDSLIERGEVHEGIVRYGP